jgi:hypothetical protein
MVPWLMVNNPPASSRKIGITHQNSFKISIVIKFKNEDKNVLNVLGKMFGTLPHLRRGGAY